MDHMSPTESTECAHNIITQLVSLHASFTHMHQQCESMEWRKRCAGRPAVYRTFSTNHLSYTKTLVPIYIFRATTFFWWCCHFFEKKWPFCPKIKNFVVSCFSRSLNCSSSISRCVLGYIWGLD